MTSKPTQHSVTLVNHLRGLAGIGIDEVERTIEEVSAKIEAAFMAELAHLDELYTDQENDDTALELVQRFDKGYAKTMASIQAATERLVEARAHLARITNTIEYHPAFAGNGYGSPYPVANADVTVDCSITGTLDREVVSRHGATPGKTTEIKTTAPVVYKLGPITSDKHYPVSWVAIQDLINGHWPFSEQDRQWATGKTIILSSYWQCPASKIDARVIVNLSIDNNGNWTIEIAELSAKVGDKKTDYQPVEKEIDDKTILLISPYACLVPEATTKETNHE